MASLAPRPRCPGVCYDFGMAMEKLRVGQAELRWLARSLKSIDFFSALTMGQVDEILPAIGLYRYPADTLIMKQGDKDKALFVLYKGRLVVSRRRWGVFFKPIASLRPGDFFGEIAILDQKSRNATVKSTEQSEIFVLMADEFSYILERSPSLATYMRQVSSRRKFELEHWERS